MGDILKAQQLYNEAISLDFLNKFHEAFYAPEVGLAPLAGSGRKGLQLMKESADLGYSKAQYQLGIFYLFDHYHRDAIYEQITDPHEKYTTREKLEKQDIQNGVSQLEHAAQQNHGDACLLLGDIYCEHFFCGGLAHNLDHYNANKAFSYYKRAAELGNADAMYRLGRCHYHGWGTSENDNSAFLWFCKARDAGCKMMWTQLGECYMNGLGTCEDIPKAIQAFEQALKERDVGFSDAVKCKLAIIYQGGRGFRYADFTKAEQYAAAISDDSKEASLAREILADIPKAKSEYNQWKATQATSKSTSGSGGCYVATAVYGSYDCPQVWTLRRFRDYTLSNTWYGRAFIRTYYALSPTLVKWFGKSNWFRTLWKCPLDKLVTYLGKRGFEDTPYKDWNQ